MFWKPGSHYVPIRRMPALLRGEQKATGEETARQASLPSLSSLFELSGGLSLPGVEFSG